MGIELIWLNNSWSKSPFSNCKTDMLVEQAF